MASALYDTGRNAFLTGAISWTGNTISVALVGAGYSANMGTDQFFSAVAPYVIGTPVQLTSKTAVAGVADAADVTTAVIATGSTITQMVIYADTGVVGTSQLIAREDLTPIVTNGESITLTWDSSPNTKIFKL